MVAFITLALWKTTAAAAADFEHKRSTPTRTADRRGYGVSRRAFLGAASLTAAHLIDGRPTAALAEQDSSATAMATPDIQYHYKAPFDYGGVMQGTAIDEAHFVGKTPGRKTFYMADRPRLIWAHQHMNALQRTHLLMRGGPVLEFKHVPLDIDRIQIPTNQGTRIAVADWLPQMAPDGLIVVYLSKKHGPLVASEQYWNGMRPDALHLLWSASKALSVGVVAHALERGELRKDTQVTQVLPEFSGSGFQGATLEHLLSMASGVASFSDVEKRHLGTERINYFINTVAMDTGFHESDDQRAPIGHVAHLRSLKQYRPHGEYFEYKDADQRVAVLMAERVLAKPFHQLFTELIWSHIGTEHDAYIACDTFGCSLTPSGMGTTLRDAARWGLAHLPRAGNKAIPQAFVDDIRQPHVFKVTKDSGIDNLFKECRYITDEGGYRNFYWLHPQGPTGAFGGGGMFGQNIEIFPQHNVVVGQFSTYLGSIDHAAPWIPAMNVVAQNVAETYQRMGLE